ncbi:MAG: asparaginase domain-containing protein, partial [Actinobacteria bacterium]|nr:asparaginase domain-containing protein [Actinomycetota bacterium]
GPRNLRDALRVAASPEARGKGALVCLNGTILAARDATKLHRTAVQAFEGLDGPVGYVDGDLVAFYRQPLRRRTFSVALDPSVALVKAYPAAGRQVIDAVVTAGARGIVVEGLPGAGGVPPGMQEGLREAAGRGGVLVLASRAPRRRGCC